MAKQLFGASRPVVVGSSWGGGKSAPANAGGSGDYKSLLSNLIKTLQPGGEIEKGQIAEALEEGKQLGAQLNASAISKGLGNVTGNAPVTVAKHVAKRKQEIRSGLLGQILQLTQFLTNMSSQESEAQKSRQMQYDLNRPQTMAQQGMSALGTPSSINYGLGGMNLGGGGGGFSAQAFPSLASSGGMSAPSTRTADPYADVFGGGGITMRPLESGTSGLEGKFTFSEKEANKRGW